MAQFKDSTLVYGAIAILLLSAGGVISLQSLVGGGAAVDSSDLGVTTSEQCNLAGNTQAIAAMSAVDAWNKGTAITEGYTGYVEDTFLAYAAGATARNSPVIGGDYDLLVQGATSYADSATEFGSHVTGTLPCEPSVVLSTELADNATLNYKSVFNDDGVTANADSAAAGQAIGSGGQATVRVVLQANSADDYLTNPELKKFAIEATGNTTEFDFDNFVVKFDGAVCNDISPPTNAYFAAWECTDSAQKLADFGSGNLDMTIVANAGWDPLVASTNVTIQFRDYDYYWDAETNTIAEGYEDEAGNNVGPVLESTQEIYIT